MRLDLASIFILFLARLIEIYYWLIIARAILSWFIRDPRDKVYRFLYGITEPVLAPIRRILPDMGLDLSPLIAFFILQVLKRLILSLL